MLTEVQAQARLARLAQEKLALVCVKSPVETGVVGGAEN